MTERALQIAEWSLATAALSAGAFNCFTEGAPGIRAGCRGPDASQYLSDLRSGYVSASLISMLTGAVVSLLLGSPVPVLAAAGTGVAMVGLYESHVPLHLRLLGPGGIPLGDPNVIDGEFRSLDA